MVVVVVEPKLNPVETEEVVVVPKANRSGAELLSLRLLDGIAAAAVVTMTLLSTVLPAAPNAKTGGFGGATELLLKVKFQFELDWLGVVVTVGFVCPNESVCEMDNSVDTALATACNGITVTVGIDGGWKLVVVTGVIIGAAGSVGRITVG